MADEENLVSEVKIEGIDQSTEDLKKFGDDGAAAFDKVAAAAKKSSDTVSKSTGEMGKGLDDLNKKTADAPSKLQAIATAATSLGSSLKTGVGQIATFGTAITAIAAGGIAAVVGIAKFASAVTGAAREVDRANTANTELLQQQKKNNQQYAQSVASAAQYQSQLRTLNASVANGKTSYEDYGTALQELNDSYRESVRVQNEVQAAQDETLKKNQELERSAANRAALDALNKTYGTTLTSSLVRLGTAYDKVRDQARDAFGPVLASIVDRISNLVDKNSGAITKFIDQAAASLDKFFEANGPALEKFGTTVVQIGAAFVKVIGEVVIPAVQSFLSALGKVADFINSVFGTDINGAFLAVILLIGTMSGAFGALVTVITTVATAVSVLSVAFSPLIVIVGLLVAAFVALALSIDWTAFGQRAVSAFTAITTAVTSFIASTLQLFTDLWNFLNTGWDAAVAYVQAAWQSVVDYFNTLIETIKGIFASIGQAIQDAFNAAVQYVITLFTDWANRILKLIQPVIDALNKVKSLMASTAAGSGSTGAVTAAGGGHIRGPGTSTSDSIPAWLSNNEFVVRAKAVAKYGVGFLKALNSGRLDLGKMAGYAMGGLVSMPRSPSLSFADGGPVKGGINSPDKVLNLTIGGETFAGLLMPDDVANSMTRFAVARNSRSAGRRPGWVGGKR